MKGSEIDDPGHLIGLKPRRFPNWGARQQPIKICPLCCEQVKFAMRTLAYEFGTFWCEFETNDRMRFPNCE